jgi:hypothetical protein
MPHDRRALCVGIDQYSFGPLGGCVADAERLTKVLERHEDGALNFDVKTLVAPEGGSNVAVTRSILLTEINDLFKHPAQVALLSFSGHGTENNLDGYLVTQDAANYAEGVAMQDVLRLANDSRVDEVVILLDCCNSGHLGNAGVRSNTATMREGVSILTASRGDQVSVELTGRGPGSGGGVFTSLVADALEGGAADLLGHVTVPSIYAQVEAALGAWDQRPLMKSHVAQLIPLRRCKPPIRLALLQELPKLFQVPAEEISLTPLHEPSQPGCLPDRVELFDKLQQLNRVHLVVPVGVPHMYDAAMQSKTCKLTASGLFYWRLAERKRL